MTTGGQRERFRESSTGKGLCTASAGRGPQGGRAKSHSSHLRGMTAKWPPSRGWCICPRRAWSSGIPTVRPERCAAQHLAQGVAAELPRCAAWQRRPRGPLEQSPVPTERELFRERCAPRRRAVSHPGRAGPGPVAFSALRGLNAAAASWRPRTHLQQPTHCTGVNRRRRRLSSAGHTQRWGRGGRKTVARSTWAPGGC